MHCQKGYITMQAQQGCFKIDPLVLILWSLNDLVCSECIFLTHLCTKTYIYKLQINLTVEAVLPTFMHFWPILHPKPVKSRPSLPYNPPPSCLAAGNHRWVLAYLIYYFHNDNLIRFYDAGVYFWVSRSFKKKKTCEDYIWAIFYIKL